MKVNTKYEVGQKVWYYTESVNTCYLSKITEIKIDVVRTSTDKDIVKLLYTVENIEYKKLLEGLKKEEAYGIMRRSYYNTPEIFYIEEENLWETQEDLKKAIEKRSVRRLNMMKVERFIEKKKRWIGLLG